MLRIHGNARSRALRTLWMVGELGLDYDHNDVLPRAPAVRSPEFLALNPNARVPVIEDDGFVLAESMAINLYLAKKHGKLYPADAHNEALAWQWSFWETDRLDRQIVTYANHSAVLPEAQRNPAQAKAAWDEMVPALDVLEGALAKSPGWPATSSPSPT
jgi:glutathione S-transferase